MNLAGILALLSCGGIGDSCGWPSPSRRMFGSLVHQICSVYEVSHKIPGTPAALLVLGAENTPCIKGSRNKESWKLVMSPLLTMQHLLEGIFFFQNGDIVVEIQSPNLFL